MIACILCGGVVEVMVISAGLGWFMAWLKKKHDKKKCKCCQGKNPEIKKDKAEQWNL